MQMTQETFSYTPAGEGEAIQVMADLVTVKARSVGNFALTEVSTPPQGGPPMLHRHADQETFYILEGNVRFDTMQGDQPSSIEVGAGAVIQIPSMVWHNYKNVGSTPSKMLVILQPGDMIGFFRELGVPVTDKSIPPRPSGPPDMQRVMAIMQKHHVEMFKPS